jgi:NADH-quinone oxidoreductase subunit F
VKGGKYKACICGGIGQGVLGTDQLDIRLDFDDVRFRGGCLGLGTAGMVVMNQHTDLGKALRNVVRFFSHESCGQCTPCREGTTWMAKIMDRIVAGDGRLKDLDILMELEKSMGALPGTTICGLAGANSWATRTFINKFYDEFAAKCSTAAEVLPTKLRRGTLNVLTPIGSNRRN